MCCWGLTGVILASLILIAIAPNFLVLMIARALLGVVVGGFWALATATVMRLVPEETVPKALEHCPDRGGVGLRTIPVGLISGSA